jgi:hypothetical protein
LFLLPGKGGLSAQSPGRVFFTEEIKTIEKNLKAENVSASQRRTALIRQARLFQLTGNLENAARSWTAAAAADPDKPDDNALLEGAFCFFGLGELEKAENGAKAVLQRGKEGKTLTKAAYLNAQIEAFRSEDLAPLIELAADAAYESYRPAIYYTLWKLSGTDRYKTRLIAEYPLSPEALLVKDGSAGTVKAAIFPSPLWLFFPGRSALALDGREEEQARTPPSRSPGALQTGLFGKEENAKAMAARLKTAGFEAAVTQRAANDGGAYWVVTVPAGPDINRTIAQLKEKGFDSFPIF